jgi:hypothetical protein
VKAAIEYVSGCGEAVVRRAGDHSSGPSVLGELASLQDAWEAGRLQIDVSIHNKTLE